MFREEELDEYAILLGQVGISEPSEQMNILLYFYQLGTIILNYMNYEKEDKECSRVFQTAA